MLASATAAKMRTTREKAGAGRLREPSLFANTLAIASAPMASSRKRSKWGSIGSGMARSIAS
jgi:hypothetical protein